MPSTTQAVSLGFVILFVAILIPIMIGGIQSETLEETVTIEGTDDSEVIEDYLRITVTDKGSSDADIELTSLETGNNTTVNITETESVTEELDGHDITLTAVDIQPGDGGDVVLEVRYPESMVWTDGAETLADNLPLVLVAMALLIVMGLLVGVMRV